MAGRASISSYLDLAAGFSEETSPTVWRTLIGGLGWVDRFLDGEPRERFRQDVRALVGPALRRLGWDALETDSRDDRELRGDLIRAMGILGDDRETQALAREDEASIRTGHPVDPAVASAAIDVVAFIGDERDYDDFLERVADGATPQDQDRYRYALPTFRDPALMDRTLELIASGEVRAQDGPYMLQVAEMNRDLGERAWTFVRDHWDSRRPDVHRLERHRPRPGCPLADVAGPGGGRAGVLHGQRHPAEPPDAHAGHRAPAALRRAAAAVTSRATLWRPGSVRRSPSSTVEPLTRRPPDGRRAVRPCVRDVELVAPSRRRHGIIAPCHRSMN